MIGTLTLPSGTVATLGDDGTWSCDDAPTAAFLNGRFGPDAELGISVLPFGYGALGEAAARLGGTAVFANPLPPPPDGQVS